MRTWLRPVLWSLSIFIVFWRLQMFFKIPFLNRFCVVCLYVGGPVDQKRRGLSRLRNLKGRFLACRGHYLGNLSRATIPCHDFHPKKPCFGSRETEWDTSDGIVCSRRDTRKRCFPRCHNNIRLGRHASCIYSRDRKKGFTEDQQ